MGKYFKNTSYSVGSLVKEYKKLAHKYHPDAGGTNEDFVAMTKEYEGIIEGIKNPPKKTTSNIQRYEYKKTEDIQENPKEEFDGIIDLISPPIAKKYFHNRDINICVIVLSFVLVFPMTNPDYIFIRELMIFISLTWTILIGTKA